MQAEHIPVHLGSMPDAVAAVISGAAATGRRLDPQRPLPRRDPPARHHADLPDPPRGRADRLRGQPRAPRRRRRPDAGRDALRLASSSATRGIVIPPTRVDDDGLAELAARMRNSDERLADLRAQAAANRIGAERLVALAEARGRDGRSRRHGGDPRLRRAAHARRPRRAARRHPHRRGRPRGECRRRRATARAGDDRRRLADARLRRHRRPGRGEPQLPALGDEVGGVLRRPRARRPGRAAVGRRPPAGARHRPAGLAPQRPAAGGGRGRERRDLEPGRRPRDLGPRRRRRRRPRRGRGR